MDSAEQDLLTAMPNLFGVQVVEFLQLVPLLQELIYALVRHVLTHLCVAPNMDIVERELHTAMPNLFGPRIATLHL